MDLSQDILKGVNLLGDPKQIPDAAFKEIVEVAFGIILNSSSEEKLSESQTVSKIDPILVKQSLSALVSMLLEGAKHNSDSAVLKEVLEDEKVEDKRIEFITKLTAIRHILSTISFNFPRITGVEWRLDYFIKSNSMEKVNTPMYFISFKTVQNKDAAQEEDDQQSSKRIEFTCSMEQLQELVTKLKDAVKQIERSANA